MDEKMFELMSKMYVEMQEGFARSDQKFASLENKMDDNHKALYDGYVQNAESISKLQQELEKLTDRVEHQEIKLQVVKGF